MKPEELDTLKEALSWDDPFDVVLEIIETASHKESPALLSRYEVLAIHTNLLDSEVYNGGFRQFFSNHSGNYALGILDSLRDIGSTHLFSLLEKALSVFPNFDEFEEQESRFNYIQQMQAEDLQAWRELSQEYYRSPEAIYEMVIGYIRKTYNI